MLQRAEQQNQFFARGLMRCATTAIRAAEVSASETTGSNTVNHRAVYQDRVGCGPTRRVTELLRGLFSRRFPVE
jgi:hypothetical protein